MTRRSFIQRALLLLGIGPAGSVGCAAGRSVDGASPPTGVDLGPTSATGTLSRAGMEDLVALGEALVEGRTLAPAERRYLVEHIEDRTARSPGYLALYGTTVNTLERLAGRRWASLAMRERLELVARHRLGVSQVRPGEELGRFPPEMRALRTRAVPDLIRGYYGSPAGWAVVGYDTFPGRCGDLTRYTRAES